MTNFIETIQSEGKCDEVLFLSLMKIFIHEFL